MSALLCTPWKSRFLHLDSSQCCCSWSLTLNNPSAASNPVTVIIAAPAAAVSQCCAAALLAFVKTPQWSQGHMVRSTALVLSMALLPFSCHIATHVERFCWLAYWPPAVSGPATTSFFVIPVQPVLQEVEGREKERGTLAENETISQW